MAHVFLFGIQNRKNCGLHAAAFGVVPFEIPHKISYPYIEKYDFYAILKF